MHAEMINRPNPHFEIPMCEVQNQEERLIFPEEKKKASNLFCYQMRKIQIKKN
jgi:hypothetical protein